jgi:hypothetical protein
MRITPLLIVAAALAISAPALAQELRPGTRVRVSAPIIRANSRFTGNVVREENGRVLLRLDRTVRQDTQLDTISIPRELIRRVEVSLGPGGRARGPAARTGAIAGLLAGTIVGLIASSGSSADRPARNPWMTALWTAPLLGAAGAGTGALIAPDVRERWQTAPGTRTAGLAFDRGELAY